MEKEVRHRDSPDWLKLTPILFEQFEQLTICDWLTLDHLLQECYNLFTHKIRLQFTMYRETFRLNLNYVQRHHY
jgi:hypothetical protein